MSDWALEPRERRVSLWLLLALAVCVFVPVGLVGTYRYLNNFWLYRGFPPPRDPAFVKEIGNVQTIWVSSPALGGRRQEVLVYLPPGYANHPARRYPVFYLLHGFPGRASAFLLTVRVGVVEDILLAKHKIRPMILVMPSGSTGTFTDKEWANGVGSKDRWETYVARDVIHAIDARYRTIPAGRARAIGGLSEGGYGALNIGLHHPREFRVIQSWSGYQRAYNVRSVFGGVASRLAFNSPLLELGKRAAALRRAHTFVWFYSGRQDRLRGQNAEFAATLKRARIPHRFFLVRGGHNWALWRGNAGLAILDASRHLAHG